MSKRALTIARVVQGGPALRHLFLEHRCCDFHPHFRSIGQSFEASGSVFHTHDTGCHVFSTFDQPKPSALRRSWIDWRLEAKKPAWRCLWCNFFRWTEWSLITYLLISEPNQTLCGIVTHQARTACTNIDSFISVGTSFSSVAILFSKIYLIHLVNMCVGQLTSC